jgi:nucleoside-diphosphate-sugar epimerase
MRIFVTGATGVVGRRLVPLLCRAGHDVTALARSAVGRDELGRHGARTVEVDLFDAEAVRRIVSGHDTVVNLATHIPPPSRIFLPWAWRENDRIRREASVNLVTACIGAGVTRFVQESFAPAYPDRGTEWIDETVALNPVRYNRSTVVAETAAERFTQSGRTGIILRFGGFYGPDAAQTVEFIRAIRKGWAPLPGPANAYISSVSHDDAATATAAAVTLPAGIYNVVDDEPVTHRRFVDSLAAALGVGIPALPPAWLTPIFGSLGRLAARSVRISNRKLRSASGWAPAHRTVPEGWPAVIAELGPSLGRARPEISRQHP